MSSRKILVFAILIFFVPLSALASTGTIDGTNKYAWGSNIGWVNFNPTNGNVQVTDSGLSGYAWNENYGWINLSPTNGGVLNDGTGQLSGYAWGEGIGWINFSGVLINSTTGQFSGTATTTAFGSIVFNCTNCSVYTTWRPGSPPPPVVAFSGGGAVYSSFSNIRASASTTTSAIISWQTNYPIGSQVNYGLTNSYGSSVSSSDITTNHSLNLSNLIPGTLYHFRVKDPNLQFDYSTDYVFTTNASASAPTPTPVSVPTPTPPLPKPTASSWGSGLSVLSPLTPPAAVTIPIPSTLHFPPIIQALKYGSSGTQVINLQNLLKALHIFPAAVKSNGVFGPTTLNAVQTFQINYKIADPGQAGFGQVGPKTRKTLNQLSGN